MFERFWEQYLETLLWSASEDGVPPDKNHCILDFADVEKHKERVKKWYDDNWTLMDDDITMLAHKFCLTHNRVGRSFLDLDSGSSTIQLLYESARAFGEYIILVGDDNTLRIEKC